MNTISAAMLGFWGGTLVCMGIKETCSKDASYKSAMVKTAAGVALLGVAFMAYQAGVDATQGFKQGAETLANERIEGTFGEATAGEVVKDLGHLATRQANRLEGMGSQLEQFEGLFQDMKEKVTNVADLMTVRQGNPLSPEERATLKEAIDAYAKVKAVIHQVSGNLGSIAGDNANLTGIIERLDALIKT